ncbi:hypothetical protein H7X46_09280 [Pseudonocardia sp. C8]|uniref:hypothetical protein n=1 Tax=Pseudonocardia sp. C8 TaxID=2762759 RepID=UPI001642C88C|nr:hypothetical protein [Pseudonocardia sp. C8]MBC3191250.1 hypothetical protein [Pseudonocardia sp. C8]
MRTTRSRAATGPAPRPATESLAAHLPGGLRSSGSPDTNRPTGPRTEAAPAPGTGALGAPGAVGPDAAPPRPANRAERRAAKRGRDAGHGFGPAAPRTAGPAPHAKPAHVRTDFAARRTG